MKIYVDKSQMIKVEKINKKKMVGSGYRVHRETKILKYRREPRKSTKEETQKYKVQCRHAEHKVTNTAI